MKALIITALALAALNAQAARSTGESHQTIQHDINLAQAGSGAYGGGRSSGTTVHGSAGMGGGYGADTFAHFTSPKHRRSLVVSPSMSDPKAIKQIEEDLAIMSRLLTKEVEKERETDPTRAMGILVSSIGGDTRSPGAIYMEGYGVLFTLNVSYPLAPVPEAKVEKKVDSGPDSEWDAARQELFGEGGGSARGLLGHIPDSEAPAQKYDADKVTALQQTILSNLKHACNIRVLKPDDYVVVAVTSSPNRSNLKAWVTSQVNVAISGDKQLVARSGDSSPGDGGRSTMTLRVKKSELESFSKGKLTLEALTKKASISVY